MSIYYFYNKTITWYLKVHQITWKLHEVFRDLSSLGFFVCVCVVVKKWQLASNCFFLPLIQTSTYYSAWCLSKFHQLLITGKLMSQPAADPSPLPPPPPAGRWPPWVGFCFSLLISTFTLRQRVRSQTYVYQCLAFLTVLVTSLARKKLQVFQIKGIWRLSLSSHSSTQSQVSGLWVVSQGLHRRICIQDAKGSLGNCWAVLGSLIISHASFTDPFWGREASWGKRGWGLIPRKLSCPWGSPSVRWSAFFSSWNSLLSLQDLWTHPRSIGSSPGTPYQHACHSPERIFRGWEPMLGQRL